MGFRMPKWIVDVAAKIHVAPNPPFISYNPHFHALKGFEIRQILNEMVPGDILVRRHNGYLSGKMIPGYWTHASVVLGDEMIGHAVGEGTVREDILDWFRCDCCALLRPVKKEEHNIKEVMKKANDLIELHLPYDYEFASNNGMIYCTEFIDIIYDKKLFIDDYKEDLGGGLSLLPDGIFNSKSLKMLIEFRH